MTRHIPFNRGAKLFKAEIPDVSLETFREWMQEYMIRPYVNAGQDAEEAARIYDASPLLKPDTHKWKSEYWFEYQYEGTLLLRVTATQLQAGWLLLTASARDGVHIGYFIQHLCSYARQIRVTYHEHLSGTAIACLKAARADISEHTRPEPGSNTPKDEQTGTPAVSSLTLTRRETEIANLIADEHTHKDIAERLVIAEGTVSKHTYNICVKLKSAGIDYKEGALWVTLKELRNSGILPKLQSTT